MCAWILRPILVTNNYLEEVYPVRRGNIHWHVLVLIIDGDRVIAASIGGIY